jgi:citrate lyase subunit beta/citryl-CoA lyase
MYSQTKKTPRRSALYSPGANPRAMEKTSSIPADVFILDLEDAVAPELKSMAREYVAEFLRSRKPDGREVIVRVNGLTTSWCRDDIRAVIELAPSGILFPKISSAQDVQAAEEMLSHAGAPENLAMWAMIEMPLSILNLHEIARQVERPGSRMNVWVMGTNDLVKDLRALHTNERTSVLYALSAALIAARAYGISILDGVHNDIANVDALIASCEQGRAMGFDGKTVIHPSQIDHCNKIFAPDGDAVANARRILEAFNEPANAGKGVIQVDGKMVELMHAEIARETIAVSDAIEALAKSSRT